MSALSYFVAAITKRAPHSIEIRMRRRMDNAVGEFLVKAIDDPTMTPSGFAAAAFADIEGEDFTVIVTSFSDIIGAISEVNCVAYDVEGDLVARYLTAKN